jgi:AraC-like DNA-binding protein
MAKAPFAMVDYVWFRLPGVLPGAPTPFYLGRGLAFDARYDSRTNPQEPLPDHVVLKVAISHGGRCGAADEKGTPLMPGQGTLRRWGEAAFWDGYDPAAREPWEFFGIIFGGASAATMAHALMEKYGRVYEFPLESTLGRHLLRLAAEPTHHVELPASEGVRLVTDTLLALMQSAERDSRTQARLRVAQNVERAIAAGFASPDLSVDDLARQHGVSREHLTRLFTREYGVPPHRYLLEFRIREACRHLRQTDRPIKQIMAETGFRSRVTFLRAFDQIVGSTPTRYRQGHME